ncbi:hypothetical protein ACFXAF_25340 [Kitasatospora sp. NPDC059463]|uniref:hypothetical protein n=1 Tax=unclassified Kitasatospora TaxID=2633591 RepID=UPI0036AE7FB4
MAGVLTAPPAAGGRVAVTVLTGMKVTVLRRSMSGPRAAGLVLGALCGGAGAVGTALLGAADYATPGAGFGVLALGQLLWSLGWALGPLVTGGDATLRPAWFAMVPVRPRALALGLLGAGFVGVTPVLALVAFAGLFVYGARQGPAAALVAVPAVLLQLLFVVVLARFTPQVLGGVLRFRLGRELSALLVGLVMAALNSGWFAIGFLVRLGSGDWAGGAAAAVRLPPSGWGVVAVDAARRADWPVAVAALAALAAVCALLLAAWAALLSRQLVRGGHPARAAARSRTRRRLLPDTPVGAVLGKELVLWRRDPRRARFLRAALWTGVFTALFPLLDGFDVLLPWAGVVAALFAGAFCVNLYGLDAGALWLTLVVPGVERADVRARQAAWLLVTAPVALVLTCAALPVTPGAVRPWVFAVLPAVLGAAAGLIPLLSVTAAAPSPDRPGGGPLDDLADESAEHVHAQGLAAFWLQLLAALPAAGVVLAGTLLSSAPLRWAGVPAGLLTGALYAWALGRAARRRLEARGPELLDVLRKGLVRTAGPAERDGAGGEGPSVPGTAPARGRAAAVGLLTTGGILLIAPQGLVALGLALFAPAARSWFLALYLPRAAGIPLAVAFVVLGALCLRTARRLDRPDNPPRPPLPPRPHRKEEPRGVPDHPAPSAELGS